MSIAHAINISFLGRQTTTPAAPVCYACGERFQHGEQVWVRGHYRIPGFGTSKQKQQDELDAWHPRCFGKAP